MDRIDADVVSIQPPAEVSRRAFLAASVVTGFTRSLKQYTVA